MAFKGYDRRILIHFRAVINDSYLHVIEQKPNGPDVPDLAKHQPDVIRIARAINEGRDKALVSVVRKVMLSHSSTPWCECAGI
jgi:hypothetical protein